MVLIRSPGGLLTGQGLMEIVSLQQLLTDFYREEMNLSKRLL